MSNDPQYDDNQTKNLARLKAMRPGSGRRIQEDGTLVNIADCFTTNGSGQLAIRLYFEGGTVNGNLTITGNLIVEGNFTFGDASVDVFTIAGYIQGDITGNTYVSIGNTATSHGLDAINDFMVGGELEVDGNAFFDGGVYAAAGIFSAGDYPFILGGNDLTDDAVFLPNISFDQLVLTLGANVGRQLVIGNGTATAKDFDHATTTNPTLFIHSATDPDVDNTEWLSITHDKSNPVFTSGKGAIAFASSATFQSGNVSHSDNVQLAFGSSNDSSIDWSTAQATENTLIWGLNDTSKSLVFTTVANRNKDHDHAAYTDPTLIVHSSTSPDTDNTQYIKIWHDTTGARIDSGKGAIEFGDAFTPVVSPAFDNFKAALTQSLDGIGGMQFRNTSTGTSAEMRFVVAGNDGDYIAFTQPGSNCTGSFFGVDKKDGSFIFNTGNGRDLAIGSFNDADFIIGRSNTEVTRYSTDEITHALKTITTGAVGDYGVKYSQTLNDSVASGGTYSMSLWNLTQTDVTGWDAIFLATWQIGGRDSVFIDNEGSIVQLALADATVGTTTVNSPSHILSSSAWDADDAVAKTVDFITSVIPVSGNDVSGSIHIVSSIDGGAPSDVLDVDDEGTLKTYGGRKRNVTTVNASTYDLLTTDDILHVTYTVTGAVTSLTLPSAQAVSGRTIWIKDAGGNASVNNITVDTEGAETIDGGATYPLNSDNQDAGFYSDGSNWFVIGQ